jgi:hypothetical protein
MGAEYAISICKSETKRVQSHASIHNARCAFSQTYNLQQSQEKHFCSCYRALHTLSPRLLKDEAYSNRKYIVKPKHLRYKIWNYFFIEICVNVKTVLFINVIGWFLSLIIEIKIYEIQRYKGFSNGWEINLQSIFSHKVDWNRRISNTNGKAFFLLKL